MPGASAHAVLSSDLAPPVAQDAGEHLLYRPVPQLDGKPPYKVRYPWISPQEADTLLKKASYADGFRQRKVATSDVRRWKALIDTDRFVHFLPNGVLCIDDEGILLNGQHRLTATASGDRPVGFVVFENVPRWMFPYLDTGRRRTTKDVFEIGARAFGAQTPSAVKVALRYEEFLRGLREPTGWRHWNQIKDEHQDLDSFLARRMELQEWYAAGEKVYKAAKVNHPAMMAFCFYQSIAWPEGFEEIKEFAEHLMDPNQLPPQHPTRMLAQEVRRSFLNREIVFSKREAHLMLLMMAFAQTQRDSRIQRVMWAYGQPMAMPYHPDGFKTAIANVRNALDEMDSSSS